MTKRPLTENDIIVNLDEDSGDGTVALKKTKSTEEDAAERANDAHDGGCGVVTKVKTRWLKNGRSEEALMTLNVRELRDEAKRMGLETTFSKIDSKEKYVKFLHKKYNGVEVNTPQAKPREENAENQPPLRHTIEIAIDDDEPHESKSKLQSTIASQFAALEAVKTSRSGPAAGTPRSQKEAARRAKLQQNESEGLGKEERELLTKLETFFGGKKDKAGRIPENDWASVNDITTLPLVTIDNNYTIQYPIDDKVGCKLTEFAEKFDSFWYIDNSKFDISSKDWTDSLFKNSKKSSLLETIRLQLAPKSKRILAKLDNMLIFGKGSTYKPAAEIDDPKQFGTALIFLPSLYKGGEMSIKHLGRSKQSRFSCCDEEHKQKLLGCRVVSFLANCENEISLVEDGFCVALVYNLFYSGGEAPQLPCSLESSETELNGMLQELFSTANFQKHSKVLGFLLHNPYDVTMLTDPQNLKGEDKLIYDMLMSSGRYEIELTPVSVDAHGSGVGDDEASEPAKEYYNFSVGESYEIHFKIRRRDMKCLLEREEKRRRAAEKDDEDEEEDYDEEDEDDDDFWEDQQGDLLSDFTWNYIPLPDYCRKAAEKPPKGPVRFVHNWRKVHVGKITAQGTSPTHSEGAEFEIQYHASAMLVKLKTSS